MQNTPNENNMSGTTVDKSVIRRINSLLDECDDDAKVEIDVNIFPADTTPTEEDVRRFWERHCSDLDFVSVQALLKALLLQKRSVSRGMCAALIRIFTVLKFCC